MPGKMYHTNEVLVHLGDNWFSQRSARQAMDIAERRKRCENDLFHHSLKTFREVFFLLPDVANRLEDEKKHLSDLEARHKFAGDIDASVQVCNS